MKSGYHLKEKIFPVYCGTDREISVELEEDKTVYMQEVIWIPLIILIVVLLMQIYNISFLI